MSSCVHYGVSVGSTYSLCDYNDACLWMIWYNRIDKKGMEVYDWAEMQESIVKVMPMACVMNAHCDYDLMCLWVRRWQLESVLQWVNGCIWLLGHYSVSYVCDILHYHECSMKLFYGCIRTLCIDCGYMVLMCRTLCVCLFTCVLVGCIILYRRMQVGYGVSCCDDWNHWRSVL